VRFSTGIVRFSTGIVRFSTDGIQRLIESNLEHKEKAEIVMALAQAQIQIQAKETEIQAKEAEMQAKLAQEKEVSWQLKLDLAKMQLGSRNAELMQARGKLHMRGLIEETEERVFPIDEVKRGRRANWQTIFEAPGNRELRVCMQKCMPGQLTTSQMADRVVALYQHLSGFIHKSVQQSGTVVDIVEGAVNVEQMGILVCMAVATKIPYKLQYSSAVVGSSLDDASGSSEGETSSEEGSRGSSESTRDAMQL